MFETRLSAPTVHAFVRFAMNRLALFAVLLPLALHAQPATTPLFWPDKNGPTMNGIVPAAEAARLPLEWDEASGKNIAWKTS